MGLSWNKSISPWVSTRKDKAITEELCEGEVMAMQVSRVAAQLGEGLQ